MPEASEAVRPLARDRRRRPCPHRHLPPDPAGSQLSLQARDPVRLRAAGRHAAAAGRNASAARDRPLHDRDLQAGETAQVRPQSVLPRMVAGRAAGRVPRPHRHPHRRHRGRGDSRRRRRQGRCRTVGPAVDPVAGCRGSSSSTRARSTPTRGRNLQALFLNTRVPPFNRLDARKAINLAVDRAAATSAWGGPSVAEPTCQLLPPNFPGYRPYCPYTAGSTKSGKWTAPDLTKAKALVARSGTCGMKVTVWAWSQAKGFNRVAVKALHSLGYRVAVKPVVGGPILGCSCPTRETGRRSGSPAGPAWPRRTFLVPQFSCSAFLPRSPDNLNGSQFCDPGIDRQMRRAQAEQLSDPTAVARTLATGRPRDHRRCALGAARCFEGRELPLEARRQLPIQPVDGHAHRPALGTVGQR